MKKLELPARPRRLAGRPMMIYVSAEMRKSIEAKANREDKSLSQAIRELINKGLENESKGND